MYEVELKVEISRDEKNVLKEALSRNGFEFIKSTDQNDYYVEAKESPYKAQGGQYDLKRYRKEADIFIYTEKSWELNGDSVARHEVEREIAEEEFNTQIAQCPDALKIIKVREWFKGECDGNKISVTVDSVKFDHSPHERYFIEAEIGVLDILLVKENEEIIKAFLRKLLNKDEIRTSPGMFSMAFNKK